MNSIFIKTFILMLLCVTNVMMNGVPIEDTSDIGGDTQTCDPSMPCGDHMPTDGAAQPGVGTSDCSDMEGDPTMSNNGVDNAGNSVTTPKKGPSTDDTSDIESDDNDDSSTPYVITKPKGKPMIDDSDEDGDEDDNDTYESATFEGSLNIHKGTSESNDYPDSDSYQSDDEGEDEENEDDDDTSLRSKKGKHRKYDDSDSYSYEDDDDERPDRRRDRTRSSSDSSDFSFYDYDSGSYSFSKYRSDSRSDDICPAQDNLINALLSVILNFDCSQQNNLLSMLTGDTGFLFKILTGILSRLG